MRNFHLALIFVSLLVFSPSARTQDSPEPTPSAEATPEPGAPEASISTPPGESPTPVPTPETAAQTPDVPTAPTPAYKAKSPQISATNRGEFTVPLLFAPSDNGLSIDNPQMKWELLNGGKINLNGLKFESGAIDAQFEEISRSDLPVRYDKSVPEQTALNVYFTWPEILSRNGTISIETISGEVRWKQVYTEEDHKSWESVRADLKASGSPIIKDRLKMAWAWIDVPKGPMDFLRKGGIFRMCLSQMGDDETSLKVCAKPLRIGQLKGHLMTKPVARTGHQGNVFFNGKPIGTSGVVNFPADRLAKLKVEFTDESFAEFSTKPADPELLDAIESPDGQNIILTGHGAKPLDQAKVISKPDDTFWSATGLARESIWQVSISMEAPTVRILGSFNVPFTMLFTHDRLPKESDRIYIRPTRSSGTYSESPVLKGFSPMANLVASSERKAKATDTYHFDWTFAAPAKGAKNHALIKVKNRKTKQVWVAQHDLYRSYPYEASLRAAGIVTTDGPIVFLGEISTAGWFESLGGLQDEIVSKQRWGLAAKYFRALTPLDAANGVEVTDFSVANFDLKYNLLPGIWHYDELVGVMASVEHITLAGHLVDLGGVGAYWARTMPKIFNDLFNIASVFNVPKYVDMEFLYYPYAITAGITPGSSYALNFHGRVFWTQRFYGEIGFGIRQYQFTLPDRTVPIGVTTGYGNVGVGLIF
jgi:hypothetical protein